MSKHWTSRDLVPPSQFFEHWRRTRRDCYSDSMPYHIHAGVVTLVTTVFHWVALMVFIFIVMSSADVMDGGQKCPLRSEGVIRGTAGKAHRSVTVVGYINKTKVHLKF